MVKGKGNKGSRQPEAKIKSQLKVLKKAGLYSGDLRKKPTRYAEQLLKEYRDVVSGRAKVITIGRQPTGKNKGIAASKSKARELANEYSKTIRAKGAKIIVRVGRPDEKVYYSSVADTIITQYNDHLGQKIEHEYVRHRVSRKDIKEQAQGEPDLMEQLQIENLLDIKGKQTYAIPLSRGYHGIDYEFRPTKKEIIDLATHYENATKRLKDGRVVANPYVDAIGHIQVVTPDAVKRRRKLQKPKSPKPKAKRASNVIPFKRPKQ